MTLDPNNHLPRSRWVPTTAFLMRCCTCCQVAAIGVMRQGYIDTTMLAPSAAELNIIDYMPGGAQIEPQRGNPSRFLADPLTTQEQTSDCDWFLHVSYAPNWMLTNMGNFTITRRTTQHWRNLQGNINNLTVLHSVVGFQCIGVATRRG
jgi:hypothetical protein